MSLVLCFLAGCLAPARFHPVDTTEPGWRVRQGQVLWRPKADLPELAGDLLLAAQTNGPTFVQFSKTPLTLVEAWRTPREWAIRFPPRDLGFSGRGRPPARFGWLWLPAALAGETPLVPWRFTRQADGGWLLENPRTGESLKGFLEP